MLKKIALLLLLIAPMSVFAQKFAHFKSMDIIPVMPEYTKAQTDIQALQKQYEDEIKRASDEFNKKFAEYQQEQKTLPQNIQERRQKELQELSDKGMQFQQDAQQQLQKAYADMMEPIYKKLEDAVKAIGAAGGYTYVFDLNRTDIPYINDTMSKDVTNDIKTKLGISLTAVPAAAPAAAGAAATATAIGSTPNSSFIASTNSLTSRIVISFNALIKSSLFNFAIFYSFPSNCSA